MQRKVQKQMESAINEEEKFRLKIYRNRIMTETHRGKKQEENVKVRPLMQPLITKMEIRECMRQLKTLTK